MYGFIELYFHEIDTLLGHLSYKESLGHFWYKWKPERNHCEDSHKQGLKRHENEEHGEAEMSMGQKHNASFFCNVGIKPIIESSSFLSL